MHISKTIIERKKHQKATKMLKLSRMQLTTTQQHSVHKSHNRVIWVLTESYRNSSLSHLYLDYYMLSMKMIQTDKHSFVRGTYNKNGVAVFFRIPLCGQMKSRLIKHSACVNCTEFYELCLLGQWKSTFHIKEKCQSGFTVYMGVSSHRIIGPYRFNCNVSEESCQISETCFWIYLCIFSKMVDSHIAIQLCRST